MFTVTGKRALLVTAIVCTTIGAGAVVAVQASAAGGSGGPSPSLPTPSAPPKPGTSTTPPPVRPLTASGQLSPATTATNAHCGQTLTASLTLNGDLFCSGTGLTVTGPSVTLNLGGHEIAGPGYTGYTGVTLSGTTDTVTNGLITNFSYGVQVKGATDTVSALRATYNLFGVLDFGQGTKITNSVAASNNAEGIYNSGTGGTYSGDHEVSNGSSGLFVFGQKLTVTGNVANGNTYYGIYDGGFANKLTTNTTDFNGYDGIYIAEVGVIDGAGNTAKGNDTTTGQTLEQCYGIVCK